MSTKPPPRRLIFRWSTLKGLLAILLFLVIALLIEYLVVIYAVNLGVGDEQLVQGSFHFPGTNWIITISISPLFHLIPIAVVISLASSWSYLTKNVAVKHSESFRGQTEPPTKEGKEGRSKKAENFASKIRQHIVRFKRDLLKIKGISYLWRKIHFARATIRSGLIVFLLFGVFLLVISLLAHPQLIHHVVSDSYRTNPSLLRSVKTLNNFGRGLAETLAPIGWISSASRTVLLSIGPGLREFTLKLGGSLEPLVKLDPVGKYLAFQNIGAWISALTILFYVGYRRRSHRYKRR